MESSTIAPPPRPRPLDRPGGHRGAVVLVACAFSAGVHLALTPEHLSEAPLLGAGFVASAAALLTLGLTVYLRPDARGPAIAVAVLAAGLIVGYVVSRTAGLPLLHPEREPVDAVGLASKAAELVALLVSLRLASTAVAGSAGHHERRRTRWTTITPTHRAGS